MSPPDLTPELQHITSPRECAELAQVLADVWGLAERSGVGSPDLLRALAYSGGYLVGVRVGGHLVGGGFGWPTKSGGEWRLHSHVVGFLPQFRGLGLGAKIKHHQRQWAGETGLAAIEWTYDPLHAVNARFNLIKLGARVERFHPNFYGEMDDAFHSGLPTPRFVVRWGLHDQPPVSSQPLPLGHTLALLSNVGGVPQVGELRAGLLRAAIPADIVALRRADNGLALAWTKAFAHTVGAALEAGAQVVGFSSGGFGGPTKDNEYLLTYPT